MNDPIPPEKLEQVKAELFTRGKIAAIKVYREGTSVGLAEAKNAVEKLEAELRATSPERFTAATQGKGCVGMLAGICALVVAAVCLWKFIF